MKLEVRPLSRRDERGSFDCGNEELDFFFRRYAGQSQFRHHIGTTYVAAAEGEIFGFATVAVGSIELDELSEQDRAALPAYPLPILRLARLGVSVRYRGAGTAALLLRQVFELALELRDRTGCIGVVVDAKPDAVAFYERYGFTALPDVVEGRMRWPPRSVPMFLSIRDVAHAARR
jgi:GNAT superfamily N-acetyltransferase